MRRSADCEWGMVSRDGWVVYDDTQNYLLDENDWWVPVANATPSPRSCTAGSSGTDAASPTRSNNYPNGAEATSAADCCNKCFAESDCTAWVYETTPGTPNCWPLQATGGSVAAQSRVLGIVQVGYSYSLPHMPVLYHS